jgi:hypothetical protein
MATIGANLPSNKLLKLQWNCIKIDETDLLYKLLIEPINEYELLIFDLNEFSLYFLKQNSNQIQKLFKVRNQFRKITVLANKI